MFPLKHFESHINEKVLQRGQNYYEDGAVIEFENCGGNSYRGIVSGSRRYTISVRLSSGAVSDVSCDCPFDVGQICKHGVAMLYTIRDGCVRPQEGLHSAELNIKDRLLKLSKKELVEFVSREQKDNYALQRHIAFAYGSEDNFEDKRFIKNIIRDALNGAKDRHGCIGYRESADAASGALEVLAFAEQFLISHPRAALRICQSVIDIMSPTLVRCDDSNGDIGGSLRQSLEILHALARQPLDNKLHKEFMSYLLAEHSKEAHEGWDVPWELLSIAAELSTKADMDKLFSAIDAYVLTQNAREKSAVIPSSDGFIRRYNQERAAKAKLTAIQKNCGEQEVDAFLMEHISLPDICEEAVDLCMKKNDLVRARMLAHQGMLQAKREKYLGTEFSFCRKLLVISQAEENSSEIVRHAKFLFLEGHEHEEKYYDLLKKHASRTEWADVWEEITHALSDGGRNALAVILKKEKMWTELMNFVEERPYLADEYDSCLAAQFPKRLAMVYKALAEEDMEYPGGRGQYQDKCEFLRRVHRLGEEKLVATVVNEWRAKFQKRKALMEELRNAGF